MESITNGSLRTSEARSSRFLTCWRATPRSRSFDLREIYLTDDPSLGHVHFRAASEACSPARIIHTCLSGVCRGRPFCQLSDLWSYWPCCHGLILDRSSGDTMDRSSGDTIPNCFGVPGTQYLTAGRTRGNQGENGHCG